MTAFLKPGVFGPTGHKGALGWPGMTSGWTIVINAILRPLGFGLIFWKNEWVLFWLKGYHLNTGWRNR
jgi:hypothetical protein